THGVSVAYSATNAVNLALLAARCPAGTARIISEHTSPDAYLAEAKLAWLRRRAMQRYYPRADTVAVPTAAIARELRIAVARPLATTVLSNPVVERITPLGPRTRSAPPQIVAAGRLVPAKGFDILIDACARLKARGVPFRLTLCGEGPLRDQLAAQIARAGLDESITLAGHCDPLGRTLAAADLLISASRREGFGNVMVEAMAAGTPVLATTTSGATTLIRDGVNGFLCPPDDAEALAEAIAALLTDPARAAAVRDEAHATAAGYEAAASTRGFEALVDRVADYAAERAARGLNPISTRCVDKTSAVADRGDRAP
ncbi:MAG TPA: glycosyltransferase, partial [Sphingomonas sp.]|uniref:glycosyltransferase n=1 Tax=Sphingomonas sp. TaxID=28214 RepID=UPI002ED7F929